MVKKLLDFREFLSLHLPSSKDMTAAVAREVG
jgi:hypothetical protein